MKWIASKIDQTIEIQINSNGNDDQPLPIEQSTIKPNVCIIIMLIGPGLQKLEYWSLI